MRSLLRMQHRSSAALSASSRSGCSRPDGSVWVVTRGATYVNDAMTQWPRTEQPVGFCRTAALEYPQVWAASPLTQHRRRLVRADPASPTRPSGGPDRPARKRGFTFRGWSPDRPAHAGSLQFTRSGATYLVTGGLGHRSEIAMPWLSAGASWCSPVAEPPTTPPARIDALGERYGCTIVGPINADVADPHDVARLLATVQPTCRRWPASSRRR